MGGCIHSDSPGVREATRVARFRPDFYYVEHPPLAAFPDGRPYLSRGPPESPTPSTTDDSPEQQSAQGQEEQEPAEAMDMSKDSEE